MDALGPLVQEDPEKQIELDRMKRRATALLIVSVAVFLVALAFEARYPWIGYVRATAEAAIVGGLADWFAVTALFRHPLGIPIPHTAIIPARKDRIGRTMGNFVQRNFLAPEVIGARLRALHLAERGARWLTVPENSERLSQTVARGIAGAVRVLRDEDVELLIDQALIARVRELHVAPLLGTVLTLITANGRHQELLDEALRLVARLVKENEEAIRERVRAESPWWLPDAIDNKIHEKIVSGIERTLVEVGEHPEHPLRLRFNAALEAFIERLKTAPDVAARLDAVKEELLDHPAVREFSASLWADAKRTLIGYAERKETGAGIRAIARGLQSIGHTLLTDPALLEKADRWLVEAAVTMVEQYRAEVGRFISDTVAAWDPQVTSQRIELQIGRDLQFVRINGTVVGGLVGLLLYTLTRWLA